MTLTPSHKQNLEGHTRKNSKTYAHLPRHTVKLTKAQADVINTSKKGE